MRNVQTLYLDFTLGQDFVEAMVKLVKIEKKKLFEGFVEWIKTFQVQDSLLLRNIEKETYSISIVPALLAYCLQKKLVSDISVFVGKLDSFNLFVAMRPLTPAVKARIHEIFHENKLHKVLQND